jgi:hypothetical protein
VLPLLHDGVALPERHGLQQLGDDGLLLWPQPRQQRHLIVNKIVNDNDRKEPLEQSR